ncbi:MAG: Bifunctional phosphoglucose/phosphomannose isomerase [Patescibacteria group bacterium]|mgnify:FL=1|nr:Bifunctional phosphoglucose/phosphomannose isomerase [Patescibacteria group bacterium]
MIHPLDTYNFRQMILDSPDQFMVGLKIAQDIKLPGTFKSVMISGMGGSALPGNLFRVYLSDLARREKIAGQRVGIFQNRFYGLPYESFDNCLNFICSYSGNTEETIAAFEEALEHHLPCVGFSSGGKVESLCLEHHIPHVNMPIPVEGFQPRMGTGYFIGAMYQVLVNQGMVPDTTEEISRYAGALKAKLEEYETIGKALAQKLVGTTPVIYSTVRYKSVAMIWKIKINENAKTPAFWNFFPELNHNEMVGFTLPQAKFTVVMLRDSDDHPKNKKRFEVTAGLLREKGVSVEIVEMPGETVFEKMFGSILIADFTSYYLALEYGQDPTPVNMVEQLKKML